MRFARKLTRSMNSILNGTLVGTAVALLLLAAEYFALRAGAVERAKQARLTHRRTRGTPQFNDSERRQIASSARFCALVPPVFAAASWLFWG